MIDPDLLLADLSVFSDLGVSPPEVHCDANGIFVARLIKGGETLILRFLLDGAVEEEINETVSRHISYRSLLASDRFGRLREWASVQARVLTTADIDANLTIEVTGFLRSANTTVNVEQIDARLSEQKSSRTVNILVIDGPAGIGKTEFIRSLARRRAQEFLRTQRALILHVQSRGRVLTFLQDLIAFSLQTLRLGVTFDQVPVLVRNGLVTIAIDGFDELGDPSGYETAWAQINDLIGQVRGEGMLIMAGRETFIGAERIRRDIKALKTDDVVDSLTLRLPDPGQAREWLGQRGWTREQFDALEELFEPGAFSLRPLFLSRLGEADIGRRLAGDSAEAPLSFLIDTMVEREAGKFGEPVEAILLPADRKAFILGFLGEVARDMADNQSDAADEAVIAWAAESNLGDKVPDEIRRLIINRALVMAFLAPDERPRHRRFSHSQLQNYFLGAETISAIGRGEVPKFLRRNLIGADFLITFAEVVEQFAMLRPNDLAKFMVAARTLLSHYRDVDRGGRNLAALLITCAPVASLVDGLEIQDQQVDDALVRGTATSLRARRCTINQLDIRDADISSLTFEECHVAGLVINKLSRVNPTFRPEYIQFESDDGGAVRLITDNNEIVQVLSSRGGVSLDLSGHKEMERRIATHPIYLLLDRVLRHRGHWIRESGDDILTEKISSDDYWPALKEALRKHEFLREEVRQASGRSSLFVHVRNANSLMSDEVDEASIAFRRELESFVRTDLASAG